MNFQKFYHIACQNRCIVERFFSRVSFQMPSQIIWVNKCKVALVALRRFFSRVSFQMFSQIACQNTCIVAFVAFVPIFSSVNFQMWSNCLPEQMHSCSGFPWMMCFLTEISNVSSNCLLEQMQSRIACIEMIFPKRCCQNRFIVTLVELKQFFLRVSFQMTPWYACLNRCKVVLVTFVWFVF